MCLTLPRHPAMVDSMKIGSIVEYIDQQKIISAVILSEIKGRLRLLNENSREVNFSEKRLSHISQINLDTGQSRITLVSQLKQVTENRKKLSETIDIQDLWEILQDETDEIDMAAMTLFCFDPPSPQTMNPRLSGPFSGTGSISSLTISSLPPVLLPRWRRKKEGSKNRNAGKILFPMGWPGWP